MWTHTIQYTQVRNAQCVHTNTDRHVPSHIADTLTMCDKGTDNGTIYSYK